MSVPVFTMRHGETPKGHLVMVGVSDTEDFLGLVFTDGRAMRVFREESDALSPARATPVFGASVVDRRSLFGLGIVDVEDDDYRTAAWCDKNWGKGVRRCAAAACGKRGKCNVICAYCLATHYCTEKCRAEDALGHFAVCRKSEVVRWITDGRECHADLVATGSFGRLNQIRRVALGDGAGKTTDLARVVAVMRRGSMPALSQLNVEYGIIDIIFNELEEALVFLTSEWYDETWGVGWRRCHHCGRVAESMPRCSKCDTVNYCNAECQKTAWASHKKSCMPCERREFGDTV